MRTLLVRACSVVAVVTSSWCNEWHTTEQTCDDDEADMPRTQTTMLLQTHHRLERDPVKHASTLETCPLEKFQDSLAWMLDNKLLPESNITNSAKTRYLELAEQQKCGLGPEWYVSQKPLVINVGDGSTATRWLDDVMTDLGFKTWHMGGVALRDDLGFFTHVNGTFQVDDFEFLSDTPAAALTWQFLQSHPQALFLMTMRDPVAWAKDRIAKHPIAHQALPCGMARMTQCHLDAKNPVQQSGCHEDSKNPVQQSYVAYCAWAKCVIPEDRFLATNVFIDEHSDVKFVEELISFLERHGLQKPDWEKRTALVRASVS